MEHRILLPVTSCLSRSVKSAGSHAAVEQRCSRHVRDMETCGCTCTLAEKIVRLGAARLERHEERMLQGLGTKQQSGGVGCIWTSISLAAEEFAGHGC